MSTPSRFPPLSAVVLSTLLAACASAPKPPPAPAARVPAGPVPDGPITPRFHWPEGLSAQVTYSTSRTRAGEDSEFGESRYRMVVRGDGDVLKVVSEDIELPPEAREAAGSEPLSIPTMVVRRNGDFLRIEGADAVLEQVGELLAQEGEEKAQRERVLAVLRASMEEGARELWHVQVAGWLGVTLEPGTPVTRPGRLAPSALASVEVPVTETLVYEGAVPCTEEATEKHCVRLVLQAKPVESELPKVKAAFLERMKGLAGGEGPEPTLDELRVEHRTELVTEPASLIPHRVRTTRRTLVTFISGEGVRGEDDQREQVDSVYVYAEK